MEPFLVFGFELGLWRIDWFGFMLGVCDNCIESMLQTSTIITGLVQIVQNLDWLNGVPEPLKYPPSEGAVGEEVVVRLETNLVIDTTSSPTHPSYNTPIERQLERP